MLPRVIKGSLVTSPSLPETDSHSTSVTVHTALSEQISTIRRFWRGQCGKIVMGLSNAAKLALTAPALITKHQTGDCRISFVPKTENPKNAATACTNLKDGGKTSVAEWGKLLGRICFNTWQADDGL